MPARSSRFAGAAEIAQPTHPVPARTSAGSTAWASTAVVELVRKTAPIWPKPTSAASARPAAGREPGA